MGQNDSDRKDVELALGIEGGLTAWEMDFLDSLNGLVTSGGCLSPRQREVLDNILRRFDL